MRFLVEVNALGKTEAKRYGIDADTWQRALQETRKLRGEDPAISGFSIELLDDGCRAVDPMARLRYIVKKGNEALGLGELSDGPAQATRPPVPPAEPVTAPKVPATKLPAVAPAVPRAAPSGPAAVAPAPPKSAPAAPPAPSAPAAAPSAPAAAAPPPPPSHRPPASQRMPASQRPPAPVVPATRPSGAPAARVPPAPQTAPLLPRDEGPMVKVLSRREQAPTSALPLYYREEAVLVPTGAATSEIERLLRAHLTSLHADLEKRPRGKFVQIAAFDVPRTEKVRPLVVLSWKDWKGVEPTFAYPREQKQANGTAVTSDAPTVSADVRGVHAAIDIPKAPPAPVDVLAATTKQAAEPVPPVTASAPPPPPPPPPPVASTPSRAPSGSSGQFAAADGTGRRRALGDKRVAGEDLIAQLFEEMHALHFLNDALEGGHFCLAVAMEKLPSRGAYLHLYDIDKREFVLVCTRGTGTETVLLRRTGETDSLLAGAMRKRRALIVNGEADDPGMGASRFAPLGGARRAIVSPVMQAGRFLGAIEIVNPIDGAPFSELEGNAITYMAEQYAEFVAARGVVLEPEKVSRASEAARA